MIKPAVLDRDMAAANVNSGSSAIYMDDLNNKQRDYETKVDVLKNLQSALQTSRQFNGPLSVYMEDLDAQIAALEKEKYEIHRNERVGRRRFLDDDPQGGVSGILGIRTTDDKVLLTFWIALGVWLAAVAVLAIGLYSAELGLTTGMRRAAFVFFLYGGCAYIAWFFIHRYA
jgi:hypothetical protein